jgi:hypothetical protein
LLGRSVPRVHDRLGPAGALLGGGALTALGYFALGLVPVAAVAAGALALEATGVGIATVASVSLRQRAVGPGFLGRANNAFRIAVYAAAALGAIVARGLATRFGLVAPILAGAVAQAAVLVAIAGPLTARIRRFGTEPSTAPGLGASSFGASGSQQADFASEPCEVGTSAATGLVADTVEV